MDRADATRTITRLEIDGHAMVLSAEHDVLDLMRRIEEAARGQPTFVDVAGDRAIMSVLITANTRVMISVEQVDRVAPTVAPNEAHVWSLATLEATVLETLDLARLRLVDGESLGSPTLVSGATVPRLGHYLPAIYLAAAPAADTVTTDLGRVTAPVPS